MPATRSHPTLAPVAQPAVDWSTVWDSQALLAHRPTLASARLQRVRQFMRSAGLPAVLIVDPNNIFYATGARNMMIFCLRAPTRYLLLFAEGPSILFEYMGSEHLADGLPTVDVVRPATAVSWLGSAGQVEAAARRFAREIADTIRTVDPGIDCLGVDRFHLAALDALRAEGLHLRDADDAFVPARAVKLPIELPYVREALRHVEAGVARFEAAIQPGRSEAEIWSHLWLELMAKDGQYISTRLCQSGPRTFPYFQECSHRAVQPGNLLALDTDAVGYEGYCADLSRTFLCGDGRPSAAQRQLYQLAEEQLAHNAALLAPGRSFAELAQQAWPCPEEYRPWRYGLIGHGLGLAGEFPNIPHHDPGTPYPVAGALEPGMVICLESYVGSPRHGQGVKLENQYLIHDTHVEQMSSYPHDPRLGGR
ncbi:MAG: Xaa-Pro peptidase family protein [Rhodoferax sp.]